MPKYGRFQFADDAEITRSAGSDWICDKRKQWRKLRGWDSAASKWKLTDVGKDYYKEHGGSEWVISVPVHYLIAKPNDKEVSYRGYFPVSQLRSSLKDKINALVNRGATNVEEIKRLVLKLSLIHI